MSSRGIPVAPIEPDSQKVRAMSNVSLYIDRIANSLRERGLLGTVQASWSFLEDSIFDYRYGTNTKRWEPLDKYDIMSEYRSSGNRYQATKAKHMTKLLRAISFPPESVFVDFGSGKGRVLLIASGYRFKKVVGVEFSKELCVIARENLARYRKKVPQGVPVEIVDQDATQYQIGADENVFFFYNPFHEDVFLAVLKNIEGSLRTHPRRIWIIYHAPVYRDLVEKTGVFVKSGELKFRESEFFIYVNRQAQNQV
jgi:hypothetical protein